MSNERVFTHRIDADLELRLLVASDSARLFALVEQNRAHLREWLPWVDSHADEAASTRFITWSLQRFVEGRDIVAAMWYRGAMAGLVGLHGITPGGSAFVGYWISREHEGRGIVTRSVRAIVSHGFDDLELHRIEIRCAPGNERSMAIPRRLGFRHEGTLREAELLHDRRVDSMIFGMLRSEWSSGAGSGPGRPGGLVGQEGT